MHELVDKSLALWFCWVVCWKSQIHIKREGNHCDFQPNTFIGESHLYLREKNYFPLKTSNLETIIKVCFDSYSISYSIFQNKSKTYIQLLGSYAVQNKGVPTKPHPHPCYWARLPVKRMNNTQLLITKELAILREGSSIICF